MKTLRELKPVFNDGILVLELPTAMQSISWAIVGGGHALIDEVVWIQVHNRELPEGVDPKDLIAQRLTASPFQLKRPLVFLTSHDVGNYVDHFHGSDALGCRCFATVGLGNGCRIGDEPGFGRVGTINVFCLMNAPLSPSAHLEALCMVAEARTLACLELGLPSPQSGHAITGTGTDCLAVAAPLTGIPLDYMGKHTEGGHHLGAAALAAVREGANRWCKETV